MGGFLVGDPAGVFRKIRSDLILSLVPNTMSSCYPVVVGEYLTATGLQIGFEFVDILPHSCRPEIHQSLVGSMWNPERTREALVGCALQLASVAGGLPGIQHNLAGIRAGIVS